MWAFHAEDDPVVPVTGYYHSPHGAVGVGSRMAMSSLRSSGNRDAHYTEYPAGEMENVYHTHPHGSWTAAYQNKEALEWLSLIHILIYVQPSSSAIFSTSAFTSFSLSLIHI